MRMLDPDRFQRGRRLAEAPRRPGARVPVSLPLLMLVCVGLLVLSRVNHSTIASLRTEIEGLAAPAMQAALVPLEPLVALRRRFETALGDLERLDLLAAENQKLRQWQSKARELEEKLADLSIHARAVHQQPLQFVTVRAVAQSSGYFNHSVLIGAGKEHGIKPGQPVINAYGLVGRVTVTGKGVARILLLTDPTSRIPVAIGPQGVTAIMVGTTARQPVLMFVPEDARLEAGQIVVTSGAGGGLPAGLRLGTVEADGREKRVRLDSHLGDLQYLSVLFHEDPARGLDAQHLPHDRSRFAAAPRKEK